MPETKLKISRHPYLEMAVAFDEGIHEYRLVGCESDEIDWDNGMHLTSVTQLIGHYTPVFDSQAVAGRVARQRGCDPSAVLAEWEVKKKYACTMGTRVHFQQEMLIKGKPCDISPADRREDGTLEAGRNAIREITSLGWAGEAEKMVFSPALRVAGTIDGLLSRKNPETHRMEFMILDWKTNEKIEQRNRFGNVMRSPLDRLDDCSFVHYALQLNTYKKILLSEGYLSAGLPIRMVLIHLREDGTYTSYPVPELHQVDSMFLDMLLTRWDLPLPPF